MEFSILKGSVRKLTEKTVWVVLLGATLPTHRCPEFREFNVAKPHLEYGIFNITIFNGNEVAK